MKIRILNPVYDSVFKILLENNFIAKGIVELITNFEIEELEAIPSERAKDKLLKKYDIAMYSLDFVAKIKTKSNTSEHIIIEMQKSAITPHIERFRQYLGDELRRKVRVRQNNGKIKEMHLPITTIYFIEKSFNKKLPPILLADKIYYDVLNKKEYKKDVGNLIKCLTNRAYFIQTTNLPENLKGELEILKSFSNYFVISKNDDRVLEIPYEDIDNIKDPLFRETVKILMTLVGDDKLKRQMKEERIYESFLEKIESKLREQLQKIVQKDKAIVQKDKAIVQKDKTIVQKDKTIKQTKQELQQKDKLIKKLQEQLKT